MFNGIDPPPPYERNPPRDPPPPPTPVYPQLTAPTFRLSDCPIFPVTRMDDPDLKNLNAYRQLDYKEFVRPPGRRVDQTHYAIVIGSRLGVTANLETARATQINVSGGWIQECVTYWQAIWFYRQKYNIGQTSLRFRGNSPSSTASFDRLTARATMSTSQQGPERDTQLHPSSVADTSCSNSAAASGSRTTSVAAAVNAPRTSTKSSRVTSKTLISSCVTLAMAGSSTAASTTSTTSSSTRIAFETDRTFRNTSRSAGTSQSASAHTHRIFFPTVLVPTSQLLESANTSAPPLIRAALRKETENYTRPIKRPSDGSTAPDLRPKKTPRFTEVIDLTVDDDVPDLTAVNSGVDCSGGCTSSATNTATPAHTSSAILRNFLTSRAISISDSEEEEEAIERVLRVDKGKGKAI